MLAPAGGADGAPGEETRQPRPPRAVLLRAWVTLTGLILVNELGTNLYELYAMFRDSKLASSLSTEAQQALSLLLGEALTMLLVTVVLTAVVCLAWAAISTVVYTSWAGPLRSLRAGRWIFWFVSGFAFLHCWYSLHNLLFPTSRLCASPLVVLGGAFDSALPPLVTARLLLLPLTLSVLAGFSILALLRSRRLRVLGLTGALALTTALQGYSALTDMGPVQRFTAPGSIVLLGLDSFQVNRLPIGGAPTNPAPHVNAFLEGCRRFENAWTPFARTYPSWVSILTGRYPARHGARFNLVPDSHLSPDNRYLPFELRRLGYATFHATDETRFSNIRPNFGFEQQLHPQMGLPDLLMGSCFDFSVANLVRQTCAGHDLYPAIANNRAVVGYNPDIWVRNFLKQLNTLPADRPVFITAHLCGNHWPFSSPAPYWYESRGDVEACIAMVDDQVGTILSYLRRSGLLDGGTAIMLSDHGDGWSGDPLDKTSTHGDHLDRLLANKVILGVQGPGIQPGVSMELVRSFDLFPTVLELAGATTVVDDIDGRSLLPLLRGAGPDDDPRSCFAESGFDKKTFLVSRLIEEHSSWYGFDAHSRLITLRDEGYDELIKAKSYMLLRDRHRLVLTPSRGRVRLLRFDPLTGSEMDAGDDLSQGQRLELLLDLVEHYDLDRQAILGMARQRGFIHRT